MTDPHMARATAESCPFLLTECFLARIGACAAVRAWYEARRADDYGYQFIMADFFREAAEKARFKAGHKKRTRPRGGGFWLDPVI